MTAVVTEAGAVLVVPVASSEQLVVGDNALGDIILRAYLLRRSILLELGAGLKIIGSRYSEDARRLRELVTRNRVPHRFIDLEEDPSAEQLVRQLGFRPEDTPIVICPGYEVLRNPTNAELARGDRPAGPASTGFGLRPARGRRWALPAWRRRCTARPRGWPPLHATPIATGGQASTSSRIENYLGFPSGISGAELAERAEIQAEKFGATFGVPAEAQSIERHNGHYVVRFTE